jgi:hypothetical protein
LPFCSLCDGFSQLARNAGSAFTADLATQFYIGVTISN